MRHSKTYFVINTISKFFNSFDNKYWDELYEILTDNIHCYYEDFRGKSGTCSNEQYINDRKDALNHLKTQHLYSNTEFNFKNDSTVEVNLSCIIYRTDNENKYFNSHVIYNMTLVKNDSNKWKINKIKQSVLWNEGDHSIHKGINHKKNK